MRRNVVKHKIKEGTPSVGTWLATGSPLAAEMLAHQGFDWLNVDMEHNAIDISQVQAIFHAIATTTAIPFVRVPWNDPQIIKRVLDIGAYGVVIPTIQSREEAEAAVGACRYPPDGYRGMGTIRGRLYGGADYPEKANDEICVVLMLETWKAVENADDILSVPGIDAVFIGPNDLRAQMRAPDGTDPTPEEHEAMVQRVISTGKKVGTPTGIHAMCAASALERAEQGMQFIAVGSELKFMTEGAQEAVGMLHPDGEAKDVARY